MRNAAISILTMVVYGCGPSLEDQLLKLGAGGEEAELAKAELLIAKDGAIPILLEALDDPGFTAGRAELAEVLVGLMTRVDDPRVVDALKRHVVTDPDPQARVRIAREVGFLKRVDFADAFMQAAEDAEGDVRGEALMALSMMRGSLRPAVVEALSDRARQLYNDENREARHGARIIVSEHVNVWLREAANVALKGQLAEAESLYYEAMRYSPDSEKTFLKLGRHYYENGEQSRGLEVLRQGGWLLDIPILDETPILDGLVDEEIWQSAAKVGPLFTYSQYTSATIESKVNTQVYVGYTPDALYLAAVCQDAHPESLVVSSTERDHEEPWFEDIIEFKFDFNFDADTSCIFTMNSAAAIVDGCSTKEEVNRYDYSTWSFDSKAVSHVGEDFWSLEFALPLGQDTIGQPRSRTIWQAQIQRGFRGGNEWSQWTRNYPHESIVFDTFGWFLFE